MGEKCVNNPTVDCPNSTKLALLEQRVGNLEEGQDREEAFRKAYYADREERNLREAKLDAKINAMDLKLDKVVAYQEEQQSKPNRLVDKLKDRAAEWILVAVLAFLAVRLGLTV